MLDRRFRRRRTLRSMFLFAAGFCALFVCFSWYTLLCCRPNMYGEYIINNYHAFPEATADRLGLTRTSSQYRQSSQIRPQRFLPEFSNLRPRRGEELDVLAHQVTPLAVNSNLDMTISTSDAPSRTTESHPVPNFPSSSKYHSGETRLQDSQTSIEDVTSSIRNLDTSPTSLPQSIPPTIELDRYAVKDWLPRGIKERTESGEADTTTTSSGYGDAVSLAPVKRLPQALIIGVKKCGTRALLEFLRVHPDVRASGPETHFFDRHYHRGLEWYRSQMPSSLPGQITMEKTPSYFITREAPGRVRGSLASPPPLLLVVVRDPVTRALSDFAQAASKRPQPSFDQMAFRNSSTGLVDTAWSAIRIGVYARYLEWWTRYFGPERMHFISGEELIRDPAGEMALVQDFLGLKRLISDKHFYFNHTKGFPCLKKSEGSGNPHCLGKTKGRTHPDVSPATLQRLRDFYRPFNDKFYKMVGRNFGWP